MASTILIVVELRLIFTRLVGFDICSLSCQKFKSLFCESSHDAFCHLFDDRDRFLGIDWMHVFSNHRHGANGHGAIVDLQCHRPEPR